jgi:hypothetical protein
VVDHAQKDAGQRCGHGEAYGEEDLRSSAFDAQKEVAGWLEDLRARAPRFRGTRGARPEALCSILAAFADEGFDGDGLAPPDPLQMSRMAQFL